MSEQPLKVPDYVEKDENGRFKCTKCGNRVAAFVVDLGCDVCDGEGVSKDFIEIKEEVDGIVFRLTQEKNSLTESEKERLIDELKGELGN